jgi:phytoene synthase
MTETVTANTIAEAYTRCEKVAARDKPHLYSASRLFAFPETQGAFCATYASMRLVDDFVDNIPNRGSLPEKSQNAARHHIADWLDLVDRAYRGEPGESLIWQALADTFSRFDLPITPWHNLAEAMMSDLATPVFRDWDHLRRYMEGASVAPAVVFMHLVLMSPEHEGGRFVSPWAYEDVLAATEDLAIFCYWVHILRDVSIDLTLGEKGLVYLPVADLAKFGLTVSDLHTMRAAGKSSTAFQALARFEADRARQHLERGQANLPRLLEAAPSGNAPALRQLIDVYVKVLQELIECDFDVFGRAAPVGSAPG